MSNALAEFCANLKNLGFKLVPDRVWGNAASAKVAISTGRRRYVLLWMPDRSNVPGSQTFGDLPIWVSTHPSRLELDEAGHVLFCGGGYVFMRLFVDGVDVSHEYNHSGDVPQDPSRSLG